MFVYEKKLQYPGVPIGTPGSVILLYPLCSFC